MALPSKDELKAAAAEDPLAAWKQVKAHFKVPVPRAKVQAVSEYLSVLRAHSEELDADWRKALCAFVEQLHGPFSTSARSAMALAPHADFVDPVLATQTAWAESCHASWQSDGESIYAWDLRDAMVVLAEFGDERATAVLETLLRPGTKLSQWKLVLDACVTCGAPSLIPALAQWRAAQAERAEDPKWEGLKAADQAIKALSALAKKKKSTVPAAPTHGPLEREKKKSKKR